MTDDKALFLFATGAGSCDRIPNIIREFLAHEFTVYSVLTPNVSLVTPPAPLMEVPGNHWIHEYRQEPLDRYPFGTLLVAPCTFNTFNKIALGLADNLATSMIADGLGAGCPVIIAPAKMPGMPRAIRVTTGIKLLRKTWVPSTARSRKPLARAVRT